MTTYIKPNHFVVFVLEVGRNDCDEVVKYWVELARFTDEVAAREYVAWRRDCDYQRAKNHNYYTYKVEQL